MRTSVEGRARDELLWQYNLYQESLTIWWRQRDRGAFVVESRERRLMAEEHRAAVRALVFVISGAHVPRFYYRPDLTTNRRVSSVPGAGKE